MGDDRPCAERSSSGFMRGPSRCPRSASRSADLRNLPVERARDRGDEDHVVGQPPAREPARPDGRSSSAGVAARPVAQHHRRQRPLEPARVRHRDDRRLRHRRVAHERALERHRADPLAAGLDQVLGAVADLEVAQRVDGGDVAGAEPAVGGEAAAVRRPAGSTPRRRTRRAPRARPSWRRPTARRPPRSAPAARAARPARPAFMPERVPLRRRASAAPSGVSVPSVPTGAISVMPHEVSGRRPWRSSRPRTSASGAARAADHDRPERATGRTCPGRRRARSSTPSQTVGTPALKVTRSGWQSSSSAAGVGMRPGKDQPGAGERRRVGQSPGVGVEHRHHGEHDVGRAEARSCRPSPSPSSGAPARGASRPRPSAGRWCPRCST